jgi:hypothetical protein
MWNMVNMKQTWNGKDTKNWMLCSCFKTKKGWGRACPWRSCDVVEWKMVVLSKLSPSESAKSISKDWTILDLIWYAIYIHIYMIWYDVLCDVIWFLYNLTNLLNMVGELRKPCHGKCSWKASERMRSKCIGWAENLNALIKKVQVWKRCNAQSCFNLWQVMVFFV